MKLFILPIIILLISSPVFSSDMETKILELEKRITNLEANNSGKLEWCEMTFKRHTTMLNYCARGSFVYRVTTLPSNSSVSLGCGYYQLQCFKKNPNGEVESYEVPLVDAN